MALIKAAFAFASTRAFSSLRSYSSSSKSPLCTNALSITPLSKRKLSSDIEDLPTCKKKHTLSDSFLHRFRNKRGLSVTDLTSTEWCPKQMEFSLLLGGIKVNEAMRAGIARHAKLEQEIDIKRVKVRVKSGALKFLNYTAGVNQSLFEGLSGELPVNRLNEEAKRDGIARHAQLEQEVIQWVKVKVKSQEDYWASKFLNYIAGVNQLLSEGFTRELPVMGFAEDIWMVGVIDEIRMPSTENDHNPILIETKTRSHRTLPPEPQQRNGRLQLMCYKYLWDNLVADDFPSEKFFTYFGLNPHNKLCQDLKVISVDSGFSASTLNDVVRYYRNTCRMLAPAHDQLLLRYECQLGFSLLGKDEFAYDPDLLKNQLRSCLEFWLGEKEVTYTPEEERWKCHCCQFAKLCPAYTKIKRTKRNDLNIKG